MSIRRTLAAAALLGIATVENVGHAQPQAPQRAGMFSEGVTAVLVDVVVRDRRGQPVRDLQDSDFEIFEDGAPQAMGSFTAIVQGQQKIAETPRQSTPAAAQAGSGAAAVPAGPPPGPPITALVFDGLDLDAQRRAVAAARAYVGEKEETANYIGVFGIDLTLRTFVPFTRNGVTVREALTAMASRGTPSFPELDRPVAAKTDASTVLPARPGSGVGYLDVMQNRMMQTFAEMALDQQGYIVTDALAAMVSTLGRLPGRKSIVLFSAGSPVTPAVHRLYLGIIDAANRANVSIYTIDAVGFRAISAISTARDMVNAAGERGVETSYSGEFAGGALTKGLEMNEYALRSTPRWSLGTLAEDTGGLIFDGKNDLRPAFERIDSDLRNYYMLGYTPQNRNFDGKFRTIRVKVKRPGVTVAARKGYFAVRNPGSVPLNDWEASALGALDRKPVPNAFPIRAAALLFPERGRPGLVPVVVQLKTAPLTFRPDADGKSYTSDFTVLVRFLDHENQVVRKLSQHYEIRGELAQMDRAKQGEVVFYRESELPPGVYSMETVVHDAPSNASSIRFATVEVPKHEEGQLRMSSLVLVDQAEQLADKERQAGNPLVVNGVALRPNLEGAVRKTAKEVGFYFAVYPAAGSAAPAVVMQLVQNGKALMQVPMATAAADASGRLQQLGRLPLDKVEPGVYELRAVVTQGTVQATRSTMVRIE